MVDKVLSTGEYDLITVTHNETSTGITNPIKAIGEVVKKYDNIIYCVDAVSSAGGIKIEVDKCHIDICITSVQKSLGLPPDMSICTFSEKAMRRAQKVPFRGVYFDLLAMYEYIINKNYQYPSTPSLSHMFDLNFQLDQILKEGIWNKNKYVGTEIYGKTLGIISLRLLTIHIPYKKEKGYLITKKEIDKMKDRIYFINHARGKLVCELDLLTGLNDGKIEVAALDVLEAQNRIYEEIVNIITEHLGLDNNTNIAL